ncbi:MAG: MFS transporter [Chloroflexi bacterium]|nr:MFS transporter [Chloroflexota bacterium]
MAQDTARVEVRPGVARYYEWVILALSAASQAVGAIVGQGLPTMIPLFKDDLSLTKTGVGLFTSVLNGVQAVAAVPGGVAADRFGVRPVLLVSEILVGIGVFTLPLATGLTSAIPMLLVAGIGFIAINPACTTAIYSWFSPRGRGIAMSINKTAVPFMGILFAAVLPALAMAIGWRTEMRILAVIALLAGITVFVLYRDRPGAMMASQATPLTWQGFVGLISDPSIFVTSLYAGAMTTVHYAVLSFLMLYLQETMGMSVVAAGGYLALAQTGAFIGRPTWGAASDLLLGGRRRPLLIALGVIGIASLVVLANLPPTAPHWMISPIVFTLGASVIGWHGVFYALLSELAGEGRAATAAGFSSTVLQTTRTTLIPVFGFLVDTTHTYRWSWLGLALLLGTAVALFTGIVRERGERD